MAKLACGDAACIDSSHILKPGSSYTKKYPAPKHTTWGVLKTIMGHTFSKLKIPESLYHKA